MKWYQVERPITTAALRRKAKQLMIDHVYSSMENPYRVRVTAKEFNEMRLAGQPIGFVSASDYGTISPMPGEAGRSENWAIDIEPEPTTTPSPKKMALLEIDPATLRTLLQLPDAAEVIRMEMMHGYRGRIRMTVEGVGWETSEGSPIQPTRASITTSWDNGAVTRQTVNWGLPNEQCGSLVEIHEGLNR